jgi:hypothetical protein
VIIEPEEPSLPDRRNIVREVRPSDSGVGERHTGLIYRYISARHPGTPIAELITVGGLWPSYKFFRLGHRRTIEREDRRRNRLRAGAAPRSVGADEDTAPDFSYVAFPITRSALLLRPAADPEGELDLGLFPRLTWPLIRATGSDSRVLRVGGYVP